MMDLNKDWYAVLGVPRSATEAEIKRRFRELAMELHPDRSKDPRSIEQFRAVTEAHRILTDAASRQELDGYLTGRTHTEFQSFHNGSFVDRFANVRRDRRGRPTSRGVFRAMEIATSPRVLLVASGLMFMGWLAFGPKDPEWNQEQQMVPAWFNPRTKRWETPAPWNSDFLADNVIHRKVHRYMVADSAPPADK